MRLFYKKLAVVIFSLLFCFSGYALTDSENKVIFYNWEDYIPDGILEDFTHETGIQVEYVTFDSKNTMFNYIKLLDARAFDLVVSQSELVEQMGQHGLLRQLRHDRIQAYDDLNQNLLNKPFDPGNQYSIPFIWGSTSIFIDKQKVSGEISSWNDLWNPVWRDQVLLLNETDQVFYAALKSSGFSGYTQNPDQIKQAYQKLLALTPNIKQFSNQPDKDLIAQNVALGFAWNGLVKATRKIRPNLDYVYPKEGAYFWLDSLVIPANAPHLDNAYELINYLLRPDIAAMPLT